MKCSGKNGQWLALHTQSYADTLTKLQDRGLDSYNKLLESQTLPGLTGVEPEPAAAAAWVTFDV